MKPIKLLAVLATGAVIGGALFIYAGLFNIAADDPHWGATYKVMELTRNRSIAVRAKSLVPPDLTLEASIKSGAGNYNAMCTSCHLMPGMSETELSLGLYPKPPNWRELAQFDPRTSFWAIKHGIKMSGMPAWGKSMEDKYVWNMVAFMQKLPTLTPESYTAIVASSGGHQHGGGESKSHEDHDDMPMPMPSAAKSSFEPAEEDPMADFPVADDAHTDHSH